MISDENIKAYEKISKNNNNKDDENIKLDSMIKIVISLFIEQRFKTFEIIFNQFNTKSRNGESII